MTDVEIIEKSLGEQLADLVQRKPQHYDVTFSVGPEKVKVKAVKIILKAVSVVFEREFEDKWECAVMKEGDGIPLPDVNPDAFELFVKLIISDTWSVDALNSLNLQASTLLNVLELCRRFEITKGIKNFGAAAEDFIQNFTDFKETHEFLKLSQNNLEKLISCERITLDEKEIFESACRWAEHQCQQKEMEPTGENFREVFGPCFFEIRFPTMKFEVFAKASIFKKNMFTADEKVAIYEFIAMDDEEKLKYNKSQLQFKTSPRSWFEYSVLRLPQQFKLTSNPSFKCNGSKMWHAFRVNERISLHGVGFFGPIDGDTRFEVTVKIRRYFNGSYSFDSGTLRKQICARKQRIFYFFFDEPFTIEANLFNSGWGDNHYYIDISLKGANNVSQYKSEKPEDEFVEISGVKFNLHSVWNIGRPLAELLFKKM